MPCEERRFAFKCKAMWDCSHICRNIELRVLTVVNDIEMEVLGEDESDCDEKDDEVVQILTTLSLNSFLRIDSPKTTKLWGYINHQEVIVMLKNRVSHNFISPEMVRKLSLTVSEGSSLDVFLGNGVMVKAMKVCRAVSF